MKLLPSLFLILSVGISLQASGKEPATFGTWVDDKGVISLPTGYRSHWAHLGSWLVADASAPGHGFHDVYVQPEAVAHFQRTGQFPDSKGRFQNSPHWSSGWGWALFENTAPDRNVSKGFSTSCEACHTPAKAQDWVFTEGYPTLNILPQTQ